MKKPIVWLSLLLLLQLGLVFWISQVDRSADLARQDQALLSFDRASIDRVVLSNGEQELALHKSGDSWSIPDWFDVPVADWHMDAWFKWLENLRGGWPVGRSEAAFARFRTSESDFEQRIDLYTGDQLQSRLLVGNSPGLRQAFVRNAASDAVHVTGYSGTEASVKPRTWMDQTLLAMKPDDIQVMVFPEFGLQRSPSGWQIAGLGEHEQPVQSVIDALVTRVAGLSYIDILGNEPKPEFSLQYPVMVISIGQGEAEGRDYIVSQPPGQEFLVLKSSHSDYYFKMDAAVMEPLLTARRTDLVRAVETPAEAAGEVE